MSVKKNEKEELVKQMQQLFERQSALAQDLSNVQQRIRDLQVNSASGSKTAAKLQLAEDDAAQKEKSVHPLNSGAEAMPKVKKARPALDFEKLIGENYLSRIGILITLIGVAIGAKYSIDHNLISPAGRIIIGYLFSLVMAGFAIRLKKKYVNYSAVLLSGSIAMMYFLTYFASGFYSLIPKVPAFIWMTALTGFAVTAAVKYNKQIIALIGLVAAYAVPFLLSDGSGNAAVLFSYIFLINLGILSLAVKKLWKPLYYAAFAFTWIIFLFWYVPQDPPYQHQITSFVFPVLFFLAFYALFLSHCFFHGVKNAAAEPMTLVILTNGFVFFGIGYSFLLRIESGKDYLGLFSLANAALHTLAGYLLYKRKTIEKSAVELAAGLALVFITIAVPVQLDGKWVTLLWAFEAGLLLMIGRKRQQNLFELGAYALAYVTLFSLAGDWYKAYLSNSSAHGSIKNLFLLNTNFMNSFLTAAAFLWMLQSSRKYKSAPAVAESSRAGITAALASILVVITYLAIFFEVRGYWLQKTGSAYVLYYMKNVWLFIYTFLFITSLSLINQFKIKNSIISAGTVTAAAASLTGFLLFALSSLSSLRADCLSSAETVSKTSYFFVRYFSFAAAGLLLYQSGRIIYSDKISLFKENQKKVFDIFLAFCILCLLSSEMRNILAFFSHDSIRQLALTILWGVYSLAMVIYGIRRGKKHVRLAAFVLSGAAVLKLFIVDLSRLDTLAKTVVFVCLGLLLLVISFLYNKYTAKIKD